MVQLIILIFSSFQIQAFAAVPTQIEVEPSMQIDLMIKTKTGQIRLDRVRKEGGYLFYNGLRIDSASVGNVMKDLKALGRVPKESKKTCSGGFYKHKVVVKKMMRSQIGCLNSKHYKAVSKAFANIRKVAIK